MTVDAPFVRDMRRDDTGLVVRREAIDLRSISR